MTQAEYDLMYRIEQGESVFRPAGHGPEGRTTFAVTVSVLLGLREQGWIHVPDTRISRDGQGSPLLAGPCDLTESGRRALAQDRALGPRATSAAE